LVDKPSGPTSHDCVAQARRLAATKKVGHAGTLDPMATGLLVLGLGRATRLLTYLVGLDKAYSATIRLGAATTTDDADGQVTFSSPAAMLPVRDVEAAMRTWRGRVEQVPSAVSAVKVGGRRAYARVRAGEAVALPPRLVQINRFDLTGTRVEGEFLDLNVLVECSSGTYVRALARDLGAGLGVGGHLTALRRLSVGPFSVNQAQPLPSPPADLAILPMAEAAGRLWPVRPLSADEARRLSHGQPIAPPAPAAGGRGPGNGIGPVAAIRPDGELVALLGPDAEGLWRPLVVFA
jgi:tRNA pseudouridine55 synthase